MPNGREERIKGKNRRMVEGREGRQVEMERQEEAGESNEGWKTIGVEGWGRGDSPGHCLVEKCLETPVPYMTPQCLSYACKQVKPMFAKTQRAEENLGCATE